MGGTYGTDSWCWEGCSACVVDVYLPPPSYLLICDLLMQLSWMDLNPEYISLIAICFGCCAFKWNTNIGEITRTHLESRLAWSRTRSTTPASVTPHRRSRSREGNSGTASPEEGTAVDTWCWEEARGDSPAVLKRAERTAVYIPTCMLINKIYLTFHGSVLDWAKQTEVTARAAAPDAGRAPARREAPPFPAPSARRRSSPSAAFRSRAAGMGRPAPPTTRPGRLRAAAPTCARQVRKGQRPRVACRGV